MKIIMFFLLFFISTSLSSESLYIVQSHFVSELYGNSIAREVQKLRPEDSITTLQLRSFSDDDYIGSKKITGRTILGKTKNHDNLIVLGFSIRDYSKYAETFFVDKSKKMFIPVFTSKEGKGTEKYFLNAAHKVKMFHEKGTSLTSNLYIINGVSRLSQYRFRKFKELFVNKYREIKIHEKTVKNSVGLRKELGRLVSKKKSIIINNVFTLYNTDSLSDMTIEEIDELFTSINYRHIEIGVVSPKQKMALGFGLKTEGIAKAINSKLENRKYNLPLLIGTNLKRAKDLDILRLIYNLGIKIDYVIDEVDR